MVSFQLLRSIATNTMTTVSKEDSTPTSDWLIICCSVSASFVNSDIVAPCCVWS